MELEPEIIFDFYSAESMFDLRNYFKEFDCRFSILSPCVSRADIKKDITIGPILILISEITEEFFP